MRRGSGSRTDQGEVLDDCCHVTSASGTLRSEGHVITFSAVSRFSSPSFPHQVGRFFTKSLFPFDNSTLSGAYIQRKRQL